MKLIKLTTFIVFWAISQVALATGAMRIEVEVYNGPLSKSLNIQKAELMGTLFVTNEVLKILVRDLHLSQCRLGCFGRKWSEDETSGNPLAKQYCVPESGNERLVEKLKELKANLRTPGLNAHVDALISDISQERRQLKLSGIVSSPETYFSDEVLDLYAEYFPEKEFYKLFELDDKGNAIKWKKIPIDKEQDPVTVCPVLSDIKSNIIGISDYLRWPLDYEREGVLKGAANAYPDKVITQFDDGEVTMKTMSEALPIEDSILHCRDKLVNTVPDPIHTGGVKFVDEDGAKECLTRIAKVGKLLTEGAEHWGTAQVPLHLKSSIARVVVARSAISAAELGNEISARADAIMQIHEGKRGAQLLPTNVYLRDSEATDYLNLVDWLDAYPEVDSRWSATDRTRMIERLITDNNWNKINTAFAQGTGENSMVFVKDSIGNWNLKSYDNDPGETVKTYADLGSTLLDSAINIASRQTTPGRFLERVAGIKEAGQVGQELMFGNTASSTAVAVTEQQTQQRLVETANNLKKLDATLAEKLTALQQQLKEYEDKVETDKTEQLVQDREAKTKKVLIDQAKLDEAKALENKLFDEFVSAPETDGDGKPANTTEAQALKEARIARQALQTTLTESEGDLQKFEQDNAQFITAQNVLTQNIATTQQEIAAVKEKRLLEPQKAMVAVKEIIARHKASLETMQQNAIAQSE